MTKKALTRFEINLVEQIQGEIEEFREEAKMFYKELEKSAEAIDQEKLFNHLEQISKAIAERSSLLGYIFKSALNRLKK